VRILVYIQIKEREAIKFGNPYSSWFKANSPETVLLDVDNHSDGLVIEQELKMIKEADASILLLEVIPETSPGKAKKLIEALLRGKVKPELIHVNGQNETVEKMLKLSRVAYHHDLSEKELKALLLAILD